MAERDRETDAASHYKRSLNVDIRPEQRAAEHKVVPGGWTGPDRFTHSQEPPVTMMEISFSENPHRSGNTGTITITEPDEKRRPVILNGTDLKNIDDLCDIVHQRDPDVILFPEYDKWFVNLQNHRPVGIPNT